MDHTMTVTTEVSHGQKVTKIDGKAFESAMHDIEMAIPNNEHTFVNETVGGLVRSLQSEDTQEVTDITVVRYATEHEQPNYRMQLHIPNRLPRVVIQAKEWKVWEMCHQEDHTYVTLTCYEQPF